MFKVRIELIPEGGWDAVPASEQFPIGGTDEMPYIPVDGTHYIFEETPGGNLIWGMVENVSYYKHDKSTSFQVVIPAAHWNIDRLKGAGWKNQ